MSAANTTSDETDLEANIKNGLVKVVKKPKPVLEVVRGGK